MIMTYKRLRMLLLLAGLAGGLGTCAVPVLVHIGEAHEDGYSVGTLINVHQEGMLWARPAATLLHSGEMKGDEFALDEGLEAAATEYADRSERVRVKYVHRYICWKWNYSSCNIITAIEPAPVSK